jgi:hypothetical protein
MAAPLAPWQPGSPWIRALIIFIYPLASPSTQAHHNNTASSSLAAQLAGVVRRIGCRPVRAWRAPRAQRALRKFSRYMGPGPGLGDQGLVVGGWGWSYTHAWVEMLRC